ncbi:PAT family beta-lactamase induction signal transducer AmpG [Inhella inkyongensis]|uniref:PAT family beta-lactamase induction signal transducer AmpG n=1 Tax=Inhella inkyongensis TaxID=392593 RepID=A0A840S9B1_9BURK|nr:MFS transporter [Inhella inkyongensis]MBB5205374.1 PAT family beta-lactamase induction signal transducer AmpG [Inhella inkyongensis]
MRLPNLLASRKGRFAAFFALYMTEGIPLGFAATAVAYYLRKLGVGPAEIGAFVGSFYLPWAFKWAFGPLVDVFRSQRFGHRRAWILGTQLIMAATLAVLVLVKLPEQLWLFTAILLVHNTFAAMQDVAIDALACNTLREDERGLANGMMFAGAAIGQAVGGSGVLFLTPYIGFQPTFFLVALAILAVTSFVVLPMKEAVIAAAGEAISTQAQALGQAAGGLRRAATEMRGFAIESFRAFLSTRGAFAGVWFALLPAGAMSLGLALRSNLSAELGLDEHTTAQLELWSNIISAAGMVAGGWLSDKLGRRRTLFVYLALMSLPVAWLAWRLQSLGYVMPRTPGTSGALDPALAASLWTATLIYNLFLGLMYGTRSAAMMDVTNPKVAATQFTAYMALMNLAIAYSATWQGLAVEALGYPKTLFIDACIGLLTLAVLPLLKPAQADSERAGAAARRAKIVAGCLAGVCLAWWPFAHAGEALGAARSVINTFFTLGFVASGLVLLAAAALLPRSAANRLGPWVALGLLLAYARNFSAGLAGLLGLEVAQMHTLLQGFTLSVATLGALLLARLAVQPWDELR